MLVMPADNTGKAVKCLWQKYPQKMAGMLSVRASRKDAGFVKAIAENVPYAVDNGRYAATLKRRPWDQDSFYRLLDNVSQAAKPPLFITVPDTVGSAKQTLEEWHQWYSCARFKSYKFPLAFVAQDGIALDDIPTEAEFVFIGGSRQWKERHIWPICQRFKKVHVGGINSSRGLWHCHNSGAASVDGTGWTRGDRRQWVALMQYLHRSSLNLSHRQKVLFGLWQAEATGGKFHPELRKNLIGE